MRFSRFGAFSLGVVLTAVSVGTVSFVTAASDRQYTACANKKTGAMRLLSKGKCKKTETTIRWNQQGPQGLQGAQGPTGPQGATGPQGSAGIGTAGANAQNLMVVDAAGSTVGRFISMDFFTMNVLAGGRVWAARATSWGFLGIPEAIYLYSDSSCLNRLLPANEPSSSQFVAIEHNSSSVFDGRLQKAFVRANSTRIIASSIGTIYTGGVGRGCAPASSDPLDDIFVSPTDYFYETTEIPLLSYVAPLSIVEM